MTGAVEWVSAEGKQAWEDMHRRSQGADFVPITLLSSYSSTQRNQSASATSSNDTFKTFLISKNDELHLELASNDTELILGVLHSSKIKSKDDLSAITSGELEEIFVEQPLFIETSRKVSDVSTRVFLLRTKSLSIK